MEDHIQPIKNAIESGHLELARNLLRVRIENEPDNAEVWYWAAQAAVNETQRKAFLEKAVTLDPLHHRSANALRAIEQGTEAFPKAIPVDRSQVATPDEPQIKHARFGRRAIATIIDLALVNLVAAPIAAIILAGNLPVDEINANAFEALTNNPDLFVTLFTLSTIIQCVYFGYFLSRNNGQTLGKRWLKVRVVKTDGSPLTLWEAILRNVIGYQLSNLIPGVGFLWMIIDQDQRTWHDMVVDTRVVDA